MALHGTFLSSSCACAMISADEGKYVGTCLGGMLVGLLGYSRSYCIMS